MPQRECTVISMWASWICANVLFLRTYRRLQLITPETVTSLSLLFYHAELQILLKYCLNNKIQKTKLIFSIMFGLFGDKNLTAWKWMNHISHLATVEIRVVRLGSFQNLYLSFAIVEITHGVTANRDDTDFHRAKPQILYGWIMFYNFVRANFTNLIISSSSRKTPFVRHPSFVRSQDQNLTQLFVPFSLVFISHLTNFCSLLCLCIYLCLCSVSFCLSERTCQVQNVRPITIILPFILQVLQVGKQFAKANSLLFLLCSFHTCLWERTCSVET